MSHASQRPAGVAISLKRYYGTRLIHFVFIWQVFLFLIGKRTFPVLGGEGGTSELPPSYLVSYVNSLS